MEAEDDGVLAIFDHYWFRSLILRGNPSPPPSISADADPPPPISSPTILLRRHRRSKSDELVPSPALRIHTPKLQTIISGKVASEDPFPIAPRAAGRSRDRLLRRDRDRDRRGPAGPRMKGPSKSLSDLEFEELQGIIDLGFTFSGAEASDPRLISIVPGLQRLRAAADGGDSPPEDSSESSDVTEDAVVPRPYLSEAWDTAEKEEIEKRNLLRNWRIPAAGEGVDMKDHLRFWAQSVASAVR